MRYLLTILLAFLATPCSAQQNRPNIVVVLADDLGYGDVACYNPKSKIPTPNMDRLAAKGMRFLDAHSPSSVCSPTRYGLLSGRYCWRTSLKAGVLDGFDPPLIEENRLTVAALLKRLGYTTGVIGKWHLGMFWTTKDGGKMTRRTPKDGFRDGSSVDFAKRMTGGPTRVGFDSYFGISASLDMPPYCFIDNDATVGLPSAKFKEDRSLYLNLPGGVMAPGFEHADVMPALTKKAVQFIETHGKGAKPFFLYLPLSAPHVPIVPNKEFLGKSKAGKYGDFVMETDATLGAVMDALERTKQTDNTIVIMTSDNGSWWHHWPFQEADDKEHGKPTPRGEEMKKFNHDSNGPWRGLKADVWEGGHRVPFIVCWPTKVRAGVTSNQLVSLTDLLATCADITASAIPEGAGEDSISFLPSLLEKTEGKKIRTSAIHHSVQGVFALRDGPWLYVPQRGSGGFSLPRSLNAKQGEPVGQLYHLERDPGETRNVWNDHPEVVERMSKMLKQAQN